MSLLRRLEAVLPDTWSTGFVGEYGWVRVPGAIADDGNSFQHKGLSTPGVHSAGLDSPESLMAGTILVAENESQSIVTHIMANRGTQRAQ